MGEEKVASGRTGPDGKINVEVPPGRYEVRILRIGGGGGGGGTPGGGSTPAGGGGSGPMASGGDGSGTLIGGALTDYGTVVPAGRDIHPMRKAIIAKAISMCGTVDAAENPTKGVDVLMDIFQTAAPMYGPFSPDKFQPGMKQPASWCGIFNLYCCIKVGATTETWKVGKGPAFPVKFGNANIIPGDICQIPHNSHFFIITAKSGNAVKTCEGNTWFRRIVQKQRDVSEICAVFRTVPEDFVEAGSSPPPPGPGGDATGGGEQPPPGGPPIAKASLDAQPKDAGASPAKVIIRKDGQVQVVAPPPPPPAPAGAPPVQPANPNNPDDWHPSYGKPRKSYFGQDYEAYKAGAVVKAASSYGGQKRDPTLTAEQLMAIYDGFAADARSDPAIMAKAQAYAAHISRAWQALQFDTLNVQAIFLAHGYAEGDQCRQFTETGGSQRYRDDPHTVQLNTNYLSQTYPAGSKNGNTINPPGSNPPWPFIGRGVIQVTFRHYYVQTLAHLDKFGFKEAFDAIRWDPVQAANPRYTFAFSCAAMHQTNAPSIESAVALSAKPSPRNFNGHGPESVRITGGATDPQATKKAAAYQRAMQALGGG